MKLKVKQIQSLIDKAKKDLKFNDKELYSLSDITEILNLTMEQIDNLLYNFFVCILGISRKFQHRYFHYIVCVGLFFQI